MGLVGKGYGVSEGGIVYGGLWIWSKVGSGRVGLSRVGVGVKLGWMELG